MSTTNTWGLRLVPRLIRPGYMAFHLSFLLFFTAMGVAGTPLWTQVFAAVVSFIYLLNMHHDRWDAYRALNLPARMYRRHRQLIGVVTLLVVMPLGLSLNAWVQADFPWAWLIGLTAGMVHLLIGQERNPWQAASRAREKSGRPEGKKVGSPATEIIRLPQWMLWGGIWGATAVAVIITVGLDYLNGNGLFAGAGAPNGLFSVLPIILFTLLIFSRVSDDTLRRWVALGGERRIWATETRRIIIANSGIGVAFAAVFAFLFPVLAGGSGDFELFAGIAGGLITVPPAFFAVQFLSANRTALINGVTIFLAVAVWAGPIYLGNHWLLLLLGVGALGWWAVTLDYQARERNVFRATGFQSFFGAAKTV